MAHKVSIKPIPHINKDGSVAKRKKDYLVRCRSRGKTCIQTRVGSMDAANSLVQEHRDSSFDAHRANHPNDISHVQKHMAGLDSMAAVETPKQKTVPVARRGKRGLRWLARGKKDAA